MLADQIDFTDDFPKATECKRKRADLCFNLGDVVMNFGCRWDEWTWIAFKWHTIRIVAKLIVQRSQAVDQDRNIVADPPHRLINDGQRIGVQGLAADGITRG